jgi:DNA-binding MarR family transcriptional regulator
MATAGSFTAADRVGRGSPARESAGERRVYDRRRIDRIWLPAYVLDDYGAQLGPLGLAVYVCLCHHAAGQSRECWPSLGRIGAEVGCSRSSVERVMRRLRALGLVVTEPRMDPWGQRSNLIFLTDPPAAEGVTTPPGICAGGAVCETAPPCPTEGGAPSHGRGGAVPQTAPKEPRQREPRQREVCGTHTDLRAPEDPRVAPLVALWMRLLTLRRVHIREQHEAEAAAEIAELLRRGYSAEYLDESIEDPSRSRTEWPREWRGRLPARPPKAARTPPDPDEVAQAQSQAAAQREKERAEAAAFLAGQRFSEKVRARRQAGQ